MTFVVCLLAAALGADTQQRVNPVEKVTALLDRIQAEIEGEGKEEAASYDKYACFCKEQADNKQYAIETFTEQIEVLTGKIENKKALRDKLNTEIADLGTEIDGVHSDQEAAQGIRDTENQEYTERDAMLVDAVEKMKGAIKAMEQMAAATGGALVQKYSKVIKSSLDLAAALRIDTNGMTALLQQDPAASHSNEVIETLKGLLKLFKAKNIEADKDEQETRHEFEMASGARRNQITALEKAKSEKSAVSAQLDQEVNAHETEKTETEYSKTADGNFMSDLTSKCEAKAENFHSRSDTRSAELTAIAGALEMLKGDVAKMYPANDLGLIKKSTSMKKTVMAQARPVHGHWEFVEDKPAPAAPAAAADDDDDDEMDEELSFLQVSTPKSKALRKKMINFLSSKADELRSPALSTLLVKMRDTPTPFAKVKQMISDLITRLEDEAAAEAGQKEWCDDEMATATSNRDAAQREVESLTALKTEKSSLVDSLTEQITTLSQEIADLQKALNEDTVLREEDQVTNRRTVADATAGEAAVSNAIDILNSFYNPSFLQQAPSNTAGGYERFVAEGAGSDGKTVDDMAPAAGDMGEYGGKTDASKSIIGLLEVIKSDFENSISKTNTAEDTAQGAYDTFKSDTETDISDKGTLKGTKESEKETAELDIAQADADLKTQNEALQLAKDELVKLKPVCVDSGMSYKERTERRLQEVDALKQALKLLQETDFGF
jgi:hypothetical protein